MASGVWGDFLGLPSSSTYRGMKAFANADFTQSSIAFDLGYANRLILADGSLRSWGSSPCRLQPIAAYFKKVVFLCNSRTREADASMQLCQHQPQSVKDSATKEALHVQVAALITSCRANHGLPSSSEFSTY